MQSMTDLWLWQDVKGIVCYVSRSETGYLNCDTPLMNSCLDSLFEVAEGRKRLDITNALRPELWSLLKRHLPVKAGILRLHVCPSLPESWQTCPFEWWSDNGSSLREHFRVIRYAAKPSSANRQPRQGGGILLNFWPTTETIQPAEDFIEKSICKHYSKQSDDPLLKQEDLSRFAWLAVIAHGTEQTNELPLFLDDYTPWAIPTGRGLPPLIILLSCGSNCGNLLRYGAQLLKAGAQTVIAPVGQLNAEAAADFLSRFALEWITGKTIGDILADVWANDQRVMGCQHLYLLGQSDLRVTCNPTLDEQLMPTLAKAACAEWKKGECGAAMTTLLERLTMTRQMESGDWEDIQRNVWSALGIDKPEQTDERRFLNQLASSLDDSSPLVQWWLTPWLIYLAEQLDHGWMAALKKRRLTLMNQRTIPPFIYQYWSRLYYRNGNYPLAMREIMDGFSRFTESEIRSTGIGLLGALGDMLIDLSLPKHAQKLFDQLDNCLNQRHQSAYEEERFKLFDRRARCALRAGKPKRARGFFTQKYEEAKARGQNGHRELAWQLYTAAWMQTDGENVREQVGRLLQDTTTPDTLSGNSSTVYLLRAMAAWAWLRCDSEAARIVNGWADRLQEVRDSGPLGFIFVFLRLLATETGQTYLSKWHWDDLQSKLEVQQYWLELAVLNVLLGHSEDAQRPFKRLKEQRQASLEYLRQAPNWLELDSVFEEAEARIQKEQTLLTQKPGPAELLDAGLLPM